MPSKTLLHIVVLLVSFHKSSIPAPRSIESLLLDAIIDLVYKMHLLHVKFFAAMLVGFISKSILTGQAFLATVCLVGEYDIIK